MKLYLWALWCAFWAVAGFREAVRLGSQPHLSMGDRFWWVAVIVLTMMLATAATVAVNKIAHRRSGR